MANQKTLTDAVCLGCAGLCDDIQLTITDGAVTEAENACPTGRRWFAQPTLPADQSCWVAGEQAPFDAAVRAAADLLAAATRPQVVGLAGVSIDAQRHAVAIADQIGGVITGGNPQSTKALAAYGSVGATLGEVAQRADVVVFWNCDPATTHPRHFARHSLQPKSEWLPHGREDRTVIAVGDPKTATAKQADLVVPLGVDSNPHADDAALATVRAINKDFPLEAAGVEKATGAKLDAWRSLVEATQNARYTAVFYDGKLTAAGPAGLGAMTAWMKELQATTRCAALSLGGAMHHANAAGAANVLAWQSGYAGVVDFGFGFPRQLNATPPGADVLLVVSGETSPDAPAAKRVLLATSDETLHRAGNPSADVAFRTAPPGFAKRSSAYRSDGVALPLRNPWATDALASETVLAAIKQELVSTAAGSP